MPQMPHLSKGRIDGKRNVFVFYMYLEIPAKNKERNCCTVFRGLIN